ncbi:hypothetical protein NM688_g8618 [Phlebia brevispora]|uniref:Uncharacterized protein n=1 Tax=Phlebia brevispora TaxID=194682 RepID=A0ACC1RPM4_9APHY|nr:hypothetical protein NM688_g8618 [Phlebia brevispora]
MITPYPPQFTSHPALDPISIPSNTSPEETINILHDRINEVTRLVHAYAMFQAPLTTCIMEIQKKHAQDMRTAQEAVTGLLQEVKEVRDRYENDRLRWTRLQRIIAHKIEVANENAKKYKRKHREELEPFECIPMGPLIQRQTVVSRHLTDGTESKLILLPAFPQLSTENASTSGPLKLKLDAGVASLSELINFVGDDNSGRGRGEEGNERPTHGRRET